MYVTILFTGIVHTLQGYIVRTLLKTVFHKKMTILPLGGGGESQVAQ